MNLAWHAARPTDDEPVTVEKSATSQLTDFEWNELLTPGMQLYQRWAAQVDSVAASLKQLQDADVPVLWQPYPELNSKKFWWAGRTGKRGSAALYHQLFDRMVNHDGVHNLVWVWNASAPLSGPDSPGPLSDFFPGLLYVDALSVDLNEIGPRMRIDRMLSLIGTGKVIGLGLTRTIPPPEALGQDPEWAWFMIAPMNAEITQERSEALEKLYADPHVASLPAPAK